MTSLEGVDTISRGFVYAIELFTLAPDADVRTLLGQAVTIWLMNSSILERRPLHGHIRHLTLLNTMQSGHRHWRAEVVPSLVLDPRRRLPDISNQSIPEIVAAVSDDHGLRNYSFRLHGSYRKLDFCVQYRESAFAFVQPAARTRWHLLLVRAFARAARHDDVGP